MRTDEALVAHLVAEGVGTFPGTIGVGAAAPKLSGAAPFVSVIETGGLSPIGTHNEGATALRRPGFQIVARALDPKVARAKAEQAYLALRVSNQTLGGPSGVRFLWVRPVQEPFELPLDAMGYARMAFNVTCCRA